MLILTLDGKSYSIEKITCGNVRTALKIADNDLKLGEKSEKLISHKVSMEKASKVQRDLYEIYNQKKHLICEIYRLEISKLDTLKNNEIDIAFNGIHAEINKILSKYTQQNKEDKATDCEKTSMEHVILSLYQICVKGYKWSLREIDETNFETLLDFLYFKEDDDPNTRIINGKIYKRAEKAPSWL